MWEVDELSSINKLKSLIKKRYGKGLEISRLTELNSVSSKIDYFFKKSNMIIPIVHDEAYLGTAIIEQASDIDKEQLYTLSSLVKMTLTPALFSKYQQLYENNVNALDESFCENLVFSSKAELESQTSAEECGVISQVLHLNGLPEIVLKVAHQIHELDRRWGFVPLEDLNIQIACVDDIMKLGAMTIFIRDILTLDIEKQKILTQYQKQFVKGNSAYPLVIIGSNLHLSALASHHKISEGLVECLDEYTFEVDKAPLTYKKLKEVTELMFFK